MPLGGRLVLHFSLWRVGGACDLELRRGDRALFYLIEDEHLNKQRTKILHFVQNILQQLWVNIRASWIVGLPYLLQMKLENFVFKTEVYQKEPKFSQSAQMIPCFHNNYLSRDFSFDALFELLRTTGQFVHHNTVSALQSVIYQLPNLEWM